MSGAVHFPSSSSLGSKPFPSPSPSSPHSPQSLFRDLLQWNWGKTERFALPYKISCMDYNSALTREFSNFPSPLGGRGCKQLVKLACWMKAKCGENDWVVLLCCQMEFASRANPLKLGLEAIKEEIWCMYAFTHSRPSSGISVFEVCCRLRQAAVYQLWSVFNML